MNKNWGMKKVLILGAGVIQVPVIKKAKELGLFTIIADFDKDAPGIQYSDLFFEVSTIDKEAILKIAKEEGVDGVLTTSDYPVNVVAYVGQSLNIPAMSTDVAELCTNKYLQRLFLKANGFNTPSFKLIKDEKELYSIDFFPCIVKPVDSSASRGVKKVSNFKELTEQYPISKGYSKNSDVIVEEFVGGKEYSVETLTQNNKTSVIQITEKLVLGEELGYFVEDTHIEPARLTSAEQELIKETIKKIADAMGVNNCPMHVELKIYRDKVYIIEIACRLGGDYITSDLVPLSTGTDMLDNLIRIALGDPINVSSSMNNVSAIQFLNTQNYEKCLHFINSGDSHIIRTEVCPQHNHEIKSSNDRLGYIILCTEDMQKMEKLLQRIK